MEASLTCAVCLSLLEEPVTLPPCSHNFCRACVVECLSQARGAAAAAAAEPSPATSAASRQASRGRDQPLQDGGQGSSDRASRRGGGAAVTVSCPLCRKLCSLPWDGGATALPVNTTLAEVVKLFRVGSHVKAGQEASEAAACSSSALAPQLAALGVFCKKHPGRSLQLYCRKCHRGGCGQCVSEEHRGIFHSVGPIDAVYQEEKLAFFSHLKKIRMVHQKLMTEITTCPNNEGAALQNEEEIIKTEFEKISHALETKKKQLLEDLESQKKRKEKEFQIWKRMKEVHRKTVENVLDDCEKLVDECDPQSFLETACSLNQRMKTQLDLMQMASSHENQSKCKQMHMDAKSVVNDILALQLTAVNLDSVKDIPGDSEPVLTSTENKLEEHKEKQDTFHPVAGENTFLNNGRSIRTQYMSLSATTKFGRMSHEEARYNYYLAHRMLSGGLQISALNKRHTLRKSPPSRITTSEVSSCIGAEANNQKQLKTQTLQKQDVHETNVSSSLGFTFKPPAVNFNFSGSNKLNVFNMDISQKDSKKTNAASFLKKENVCPAHVETLPPGTLPSFNTLSNLPQTPSVSALNPHSLGVVEHPVPPLLNSDDNLTSHTASKGPSLETENSVSSTLEGKLESQDSNTRNMNGYNASATLSSLAAAAAATTSTTASPNAGPSESGKPLFLPFPTNSQSACSKATALKCSQNTSFSLFLPNQKTLQENKTSCFSKETNIGHSWLASPAIVFGKHVGDNWAYKTSSGASEKADVSKQSVPGMVSSNINSWNNTPCMFTFKGAIKNNCDIPTAAMMPSNKSKNSHETAKIESNDQKKSVEKAMPSRNDTPVYKDLKNLMYRWSFFMDKGQKSEAESVPVAQQNTAHTTTNNALVSANLTEESNPLESSQSAVGHTKSPSLTNRVGQMVNADSDVEALSQTSNSSDSSGTSEYFSVEEKILPS
ncbi:uncharacterized protein LOC128326390 isoform X3 [Hemicordylus capensis]|uniref:uncharacterized protein LOC128326390 isoform X3 n=1 Tax=Hemicordylus capensis TaxID=884348 RepID=UPI0023037111|nr:uncharacterized protein LOC128326390 isoform X3 [Hemicordylus capensis]